MFPYIARKLLSFVILLTFLIFFILILQKSREGSAALILGGQRADAKELQLLEELTGNKLSITGHFVIVAKHLVQFDFGNTISGQPVIFVVLNAFLKTIVLAGFAGAFALIYGVSLGIYGHYNTSVQKYFEKINYAMMSAPIFIIALVLLWVFSLWLNWFMPGGVDSVFWFILPGIALGLKSGAHVYIFTDEYMRRELSKKYVLTAKAYGYKKHRVFSKFIFKNMSLPLFSFWLLELGSYLAGAAIVEMIYSISGVGNLLLRALLRYDVNLLIGILVLVSAMIFIITIVQELVDRVYAGFLGNHDEF
ncbi:MAG: ABC transporter permease [Spirochaetia bacterium]|nr:ABC transporter permease [Spirochaetia bacterium]